MKKVCIISLLFFQCMRGMENERTLLIPQKPTGEVDISSVHTRDACYPSISKRVCLGGTLLLSYGGGITSLVSMTLVKSNMHKIVLLNSGTLLLTAGVVMTALTCKYCPRSMFCCQPTPASPVE